MTPRRSSEFGIRNVECGQMLIVCFWMIGLVSVAVGALTMWSTHEARLSRIPLESVQREAIAQAAVRHAIALLQRDEEVAVDHLGEPWATGQEAGRFLLDQIAVGEGTFRIGATDPDGQFSVGLIDEERKLNINTASPEAVERLLQAVNAPPELAAAIGDWRDKPEGETCRGLDPPCHNGPLASVDELRLVPGMTPELFSALEPYVTVYGAGTPNVNTADPLVLRAWGLTDEQVDEIVTLRQNEPFSDYQGLSVQSTAFTVSVEAWLPTSSPRTRVRAVIDRNGHILAWLPQ